MIRVIQPEGSALFVPSGWLHQVYNLDDCLSINCNWINSSNIDIMYLDFLSELKLVEISILNLKNCSCLKISDIFENEEDQIFAISCNNCISWFEDVHKLMKASSGIDLQMFSRFIYLCLNQQINLAAELVRSKSVDFISSIYATAPLLFYVSINLLGLQKLLAISKKLSKLNIAGFSHEEQQKNTIKDCTNFITVLQRIINQN